MNYLLFGSIVLACFSIFMFVRNEYVFNFRKKMLGKISKGANLDIENKKDWRWRYVAFDAISYDMMMFKFWKPLDSFYENKDFLN